MGKLMKCQMCNASKLSPKSHKNHTKNKKKKQKKAKKRKPPKHESKIQNNLNPNAKEFVFPTQAPNEMNECINNDPPHITASHYPHSEYSSPSHRMSKIPRLQKSVNPEFEYIPRHHRNSRAYHSNPESLSHSKHQSVNTMPPRFHSPPYRNTSISPMASEEKYDSEMETMNDAQSVLSGATFDPSLLDARNHPQASLLNVSSLIPPNIASILPLAPAPPPPLPISSCIDLDVSLSTAATTTMPTTETTQDLQRQLSDMEANVARQLQVLDSLFPEYKPDLSRDIENMQQSMKDMICFD